MPNIFELQEILRKTTKVLAGTNIAVHLEGFAPRVEYSTVTRKPTRIFIPAIPENVEPKLINAIHGYIDHECSHIKFSDADDICDSTKSKLWHYIHNCIEDPRVNREMGKFYPGAQKNIRRGYEYIFTEMGKVDGKPNPYDRDTLDKLDLSDPKKQAQFHLQYASLWFAGKMNCTINRNKFNELKLDRFYKALMDKAEQKWIDRLATISSPQDVRECADYWTEFFSQEALEKLQPEKGEDEGEGEGKSRPMTAEEEEEAMESFKTLEEQLAEEIRKKIKKCTIEATERFYWTDRFDTKHDKHDIVKNLKNSGVVNRLNEFEEGTKKVANYLMKDLRRLLEERRRRYYIGGYKSGKLNQKSLFSVRLGNDRVFKKKNEVRDVNAAVSLLIDMSGSMSGGKVMVAMQSAYAFAMVLTQLKIPFEVYGFVTRDVNHDMVTEYNKFVKENGADVENRIVNAWCPEDIYAFKDFDEAFDIVSKQGMTGAAYGGIRMIQNEDSKHVKLALTRLSARPERAKALFVFSDGVPAYSSPRVPNSYDQLKFYGQKAKEKYGVDIYSIGILSDSVMNFYPTYKVVHDISELPNALFGFLRKVL